MSRRGYSRGSGFRRRDALHQWSLHFGPNMTPMVDIVMVILIFFMASAAFMGEEWFLRAAIPVESVSGKASTSSNLELPPLRIDIVLDADDQGTTVAASVALQIEKGPLQRVLDRISAFPKGKETETMEVLIKPTPRVAYRDVVKVHEACEGVGIIKVGIGVTRDAAGAPAPVSP